MTSVWRFALPSGRSDNRLPMSRCIGGPLLTLHHKVMHLASVLQADTLYWMRTARNYSWYAQRCIVAHSAFIGRMHTVFRTCNLQLCTYKLTDCQPFCRSLPSFLYWATYLTAVFFPKNLQLSIMWRVYRRFIQLASLKFYKMNIYVRSMCNLFIQIVINNDRVHLHLNVCHSFFLYICNLI